MRLQCQFGTGGTADGDGDPGPLTAGDDDVGGVGDQAHQIIGWRSADGDDADVLDRLPPGRRHVAGKPQLRAQWVVAGCGIAGNGDGDLVFAVSAGGQFEGHVSARVPAGRVAQPHRAGDGGVAAIAGHGQAQTGRLSGRDCQRFGVQMSDGGQSAQRCRAAVVQPVAGIQRLGFLSIGRQHRAAGVDERAGLQSGRHRGDLVAVQRQRRISGQPRDLQQVCRYQPGQCAHRAGDRDIGWSTGGFDQTEGDGRRIDLGRAADCGRVSGGLQGTQLDGALGLDAEQ